MKTKIRFLFISIFVCTMLIGQTVTVKKVYCLPNTNTLAKVFYPTFSENGDKLLYTTESFVGLTMFDFKTQKSTQITDEVGAGYEPFFVENDSEIYYRSSSIQQGRKFEALNLYDLTRKQKAQVLAPQRNLKQARNAQHEFVVSSDKKLVKGIFGKAVKAASLYVCGEELNIVLYQNDRRKVLNPIESEVGTYLWISLSPNGKMILFTAARKGTFICDLTGRIIATLGKLNAPVWYDDNFVVGMQDKDNGQVITESKVMLMSVNGKLKKQISSADKQAMYPAASAKSGKIAYNTPDGSIEIIELTVQK